MRLLDFAPLKLRPDMDPRRLLLLRRATVRALRRSRRVFVTLRGYAISLKRADDFAKEALLFLGLFFGLDTGRAWDVREDGDTT